VNETIPEPPTLLDHYETRSQGTANAKMKVGPDHTKTDLKTTPPPGLTGDALRKWAYQLYIKDYLRCVRAVDDNVGRVLDYLDTAGLAQNTLVIYTSDQGFFLGDHGFYDKRFMYEESLRMPFLARWPGMIRPGAVDKRIALNIDFAPTFLQAAAAPPASEMQGRSLLPILSGKSPRPAWRSSMYYRYWMHLADHHVPAHYGVRTDRYKLIYFYGKPLGKSVALEPSTPPEWEFYDLRTDPRELKNLYGDPAHTKTIESLKRELARLQKELGDEPA
jgi:arylsulfatase A-like enzyme